MRPEINQEFEPEVFPLWRRSLADIHYASVHDHAKCEWASTSAKHMALTATSEFQFSEHIAVVRVHKRRGG